MTNRIYSLDTALLKGKYKGMKLSKVIVGDCGYVHDLLNNDKTMELTYLSRMHLNKHWQLKLKYAKELNKLKNLK